MRLFLDDFRMPKDCIQYMIPRVGSHIAQVYGYPWVVVRNYDEFVKQIEENYDKIEIISYDHDLADEHYVPEQYWDDYDMSEAYQQEAYGHYKEKTGLECAIFANKFYKDRGLPVPVQLVHSMNPVGTKNIMNVIKDRI